MVYSQQVTDYRWVPHCQLSSHRDPSRFRREGPFGTWCLSLQIQQVQGFILPRGLQLDAHGGRAEGELEAEEKSSVLGG